MFLQTLYLHTLNTPKAVKRCTMSRSSSKTSFLSYVHSHHLQRTSTRLTRVRIAQIRGEPGDASYRVSTI